MPGLCRRLIGLLLAALPGVVSPAAAEAVPVRPMVFSTNTASGPGEIAKINPDGSGRTVIAAPTGEGGATTYLLPDLSPDGSKVVFEECRQSSSPPLPVCWLMVVNIDGSEKRRVTEPGGGLSPRWSPDGQRIVYSPTDNEGTRIVVVNADGSGKRILAEGVYPDWSPDGSSIVFARAQKGKPSRDGRSLGGGLFVVPADGSRAARQLTHDLPWEPEYPTWSPDGSTIAFLANTESPEGMTIQLVNGDGRGLRRAPLAPHTGQGQPWYGRPAWSPDSHSIAVAEFTDTGSPYPLFVHDLMNKTSRRVMDDDGQYPSWS